MKVSISQDANWKNKRVNLWKDYYIRFVEELEEFNGQGNLVEEWFCNGDLTPLLNSEDSPLKAEHLNLYNVMNSCPASNVDDYLRLMQEHSAWLSEHKLDYWGELRKPNRDEIFFQEIYGMYMGKCHFGNPIIYGEILSLLFSEYMDNNHVCFPTTLGQDLWKPKHHIPPKELSRKILTSIRRYLFGGKEDYIHFQHYKNLSPLICQLFHQINEDYYSLELSDNDSISAGQQLIRSAIANLYGYITEDQIDEGLDELPHNDPNVEAELKQALDNADMPDSYYHLLEFIHEHKEKCVDPFAEEDDDEFY